MPLSFYLLTISAFAIGTTEFACDCQLVRPLHNNFGCLVTFRRNTGFNLCAGGGYWRAGADRS